MVLQNLKNKKIVISAGASGIGWVATKIFLSKGASVYLCDIDTKNINRAKKHPLNNKKLFIHECDVSDEYDVENFFQQIKKKTKKFDTLINNVGIAGPTGTIEKLNSEDWERTLKVNVISHFYFTKLAIPILKKNKGGSIINLSSTAGIMGYQLRSPYAVSKWGVIGLTKTLAMELGKYKIRVNAVCPGTIKGDRMKKVIKEKAKFMKVSQKSIQKDFISMSSLKSWVTEEDIGNICAFLISNEASKISGQIISVDGNTERMD